MSAATLAPSPTCHACKGSGTDTAFGTDCTECHRGDPIRARFAEEPYAPSWPTSSTGPSSTGSTGRTGPAPAADATSTAEADLADWLRAQTWSTFAQSLAADYMRRGYFTPRQYESAESMRTKCAERAAAASTPTPTAAPEVDGLDLAPLERFTSRGLVRFAVPGGSRLKLRVKFSTAGTIYVDDAAEYGQGTEYGRQRAGQTYRGQVVDELRAILADPAAAIVAYTELVGRCGICNRPLEDRSSVARGIGPVCYGKLMGAA